MAGERIAYINGDYLPESQVRVPFRDRGFLLGDGVFDTARTFRGRPFKLRQHIERLTQSLAYAQIDPGLTAEDFLAITEKVLEANLPLLADGEDYWVSQRITRGAMPVGGELSAASGPTVIVESTPLPLAARAPLFRDGMEVMVPSMRRIPPECLSPRVKSHNYLNLVMGDLEVKQSNPQAWAVLLDTRGFLTEGMGSNVFIVKDRKLLTPRPQMVLAGITRETVMELAAAQGIPVEETDLDLYDVVSADEAFLTSTSLCICPVRTFNGRVVGDGAIPGETTGRLMQAFSESVQFDYVQQYLSRLAA
jgi:branched-chain amino acid aminotransferase